jgi:hypothetical protein
MAVGTLEEIIDDNHAIVSPHQLVLNIMLPLCHSLIKINLNLDVQSY